MLERIITWLRGLTGKNAGPAFRESTLPKCEEMIRAASESDDARGRDVAPLGPETGHQERLFEYLDMVGITRSDFEENREENRDRGVSPISDKAIAWKMLRDLLAEEKTQRDYKLSRAVYHAMAWFKFGHGEDCRKEVALREHMNLLDLRRKGFRHVRVYPHCRCRHCAKVHRQEITIEQAMKDKPLPVLDCDRGRSVLCHYRGICEPGQVT